MRKHFIGWALLALAATLAATAWVYHGLPARVPTHWNAAGRVDGDGPRLWIFMQPLLLAGFALLWTVLPALSPRRFAVESFAPTWWRGGLLLVALFAYTQAVLLWGLVHARGGGPDMARALMGGVGLAIVLLGNVFGRLRRNFWFGIRTPWTLADERVWYATHRLAGKTMVAGGLLALAVVAGGLPVRLATLAIVAGALVPAVYSALYARRIGA